MNSLYLLEKDFNTGKWYVVGKLIKEKEYYCFSYTEGVSDFSNFSCFGGMFDKSKLYYSRELFPLFANRILNKARPEYPDYLRWLDLEYAQEYNLDMNILARSGGERMTDSLRVFPRLEPDEEGNYTFYFINALDSNYLGTIEENDTILLKYTKDNKEVVLEDSNNIRIGKCPEYLINTLFSKLSENSFNIFVHKPNWDAISQFRILFRVEFKLPEGNDLYSNKEYKVTAINKKL